MICLMEGLNRADGGESVIWFVETESSWVSNPERQTSSLTPKSGNINNIVWATKLRGAILVSTIETDLLVAFESDFGGLALRAYRL